VSIGLPVRNGANYLRQAIETILKQTYDNLELIISDNASTDETPEICRAATCRDPRVRVYCNERDIGAAANYNLTFKYSSGKYFKWAAHDDVLAHTFIERAVDTLESDSSIVLCSSRSARIDQDGQISGTYPSDPCWDLPLASRRFRSLVSSPHACVTVFGLIRRETLARTALIAPYVNSDRVLLAELGLAGRLHEIEDVLFFRREHAGSSLRCFPDHRERVVWFDPSRSARFAFPELNTVLGYASAVSRGPMSGSERARCWTTVLAWALSQWRPLLADLKYAVLGLESAKSL
jgi:glycosyltransferase involved in cell wall biosynthesis